MIRKLLPVLIVGILATTGCTMRKSTTARTAVEQALLSSAAARTLNQMDFATLQGKKFFINEDKFEAVDGKYVGAELRKRLLEDGLLVVDKKEDADVVVWPRVAAHGIDDYAFLIGFPAITIPVPGQSGAVQTPELAILKLDRQRGRNRMGVHIEDAKSGELLYRSHHTSSQSIYDRWTFLIIFGFTHSDLEPPWGGTDLSKPLD